MPNYTTNYNLTKPLGSELYDINVHNENMDKIDEALKNSGGVPVPTADDAGKALVVDEDGKYALGEAGISEVSADMVQAGTFAGRVQANETAAAELAAAQVRNVVILNTDPGAGVAVDYPDGTVIHVYE